MNAVWMWAALFAVNLSVLLQALTGLDEYGQAHCPRLRRELFCIPPASSATPANSKRDYHPDARGCCPTFSPDYGNYPQRPDPPAPASPTKDLGPPPDTTPVAKRAHEPTDNPSMINTASED